MAKMNFNFGAYGAGEIITRDELKKVLGGTGSGSSDGTSNGVKSCVSSDCSSENFGLGCAPNKTCKWSYDYGMCKCQVTYA